MEMVVRVPMSVTDEQLYLIGEANPGWKVELVDGEVVMSPTNFDSGRRNARLTAILVAWADAHGYVAADSSTGFRVAQNSVLSPDHALVTLERWNALTPQQQRRYGPIPDVVIELLSSPDERRATAAKCRRWHELGVAYVLMLDPFTAPKVRTWGIAPHDFPSDWSMVVA